MIAETAEDRSRIMRAVKSRNTRPEMTVRRMVHGMGYRYRLHREDLPGKPDMVFPSRRKVIFIHGCFWHGHACARGARIPKTNREYWMKKIERNRNRDHKACSALKAKDWGSLSIWECELKDLDKVQQRIVNFLDPKK